MPAALAWARRHHLDLSFEGDALSLHLPFEGPSANGADNPERYLIEGGLSDYDALPPMWRFVDPRTGQLIGPAAYPQPVGASVLHTNGLVCAPWSRLAYGSEGGPHSDWGVATGWKAAGPGSSQALTIPDMLERLGREVRSSRGRMAPLPPLP